MKYINKYSSLVPAIQGNKIIQRIENRRKNGEIESDAEYQLELQKELSKLSTLEFSPLFKYEPIQPTVSSSQHFNAMMEMIEDDLDVLFAEINNIFTSIKAHDNLFKDKMLDELYYTLVELENQEKILSIVNDVSNSFDDISMNSFNGETHTLNRNNKYANEIFYDTRKDKKIEEEMMAFIDQEEEIISLPLGDQTDIYFVNAAIRTADTTVSEKNIQLIDSNINSIIEENSSDNWAYNILVKDQIEGGAKLSLELDFGDKREISFLRIHPISDFPMFLERIRYVNINNEIVDLPDTSLFNQVLDTPIRLSFPDIIAKKIILDLSQTSSVLFDYDESINQMTFEDLRRSSTSNYDVGILSRNIQETIQNPDVLEVTPITESTVKKYDSYNQYIFAFKNVSAGLSSYKDNAYFITKEYKREQVGLIGLDSDNFIPKVYNKEIGANVDMASFEYTIIKKDYNGNGELISSSSFPILPINSSGILNERLFFSRKMPSQKLRFIAHRTDGSAEHIKIYRNNVLLTRGIDWRFLYRQDPADNADDTIAPGREYTEIEILHSNDVIRTGIYTADYTPRYIEEPNTDIYQNNILYLPNGVTQHTIERGIDIIKDSDLFLKITIRNNSRSKNRTPKLKSYKIMTASINNDKYVRL